jgi:hypothetical protein
MTNEAIDKRLNDAIAAANFRITFANQKKNLRMEMKSNLFTSINGGAFEINRELISFIAALISQAEMKEAIILDYNENPIHIENLQEFFNEIMNKYHLVMNEYFVKVKQLNKQRNVKSVIGE